MVLYSWYLFTLAVCPAGQFAYENGTRCELCPENTFKTGPGDEACDPCTTGQIAPVGSTSSNACGEFLDSKFFIITIARA